jgi:hypothetical protein
VQLLQRMTKRAPPKTPIPQTGKLRPNESDYNIAAAFLNSAGWLRQRLPSS